MKSNLDALFDDEMLLFFFLLLLLFFTIMKTLQFKYIENFTTKNWKFSDKNSDIFVYFCSKHRLWELVGTASARRF